MSTFDTTRTVGHSRARGEDACATIAPSDEDRTYRNLFDQALDGYLVTDAAGRIVLANQAAARLLGADQANLRDAGLQDYIHPEDRPSWQHLLQAVARGKGHDPCQAEVRLTSRSQGAREFANRAGGTTRYVSLRGSAHADAGAARRQASLLWLLRDVTAREEAEREQAAADTTRLTRLMETLPDTAVFEVSPAGRVTTWSEGAERMYGYASPEIVGAPAARTLARGPGPAGEFRHALDAATRADRYSGHAWHARKDGARFQVHVACTARRDRAGCVTGFTLLAQDLSERERAEQERARLAALAEDSEDAIYSKGLDGTILTWNPAARRLFGYTPQEIIGNPVALLIPPDRVAEERRIIARLRRGERIAHYETVRLTKAGQRLDVSLSLSPVRDAAGRITGASAIVRDVTGRKRAEAALRDSESRFRVTYEYAPVGIERVAMGDGRLLDVNRALCRMLGYSRDELLSRSFAGITDPQDLVEERKLLGRLKSGEIPSYTIEKRYRRRDGRTVWVRITTAPADAAGMGRGEGPGGRADQQPYRISVVEDITERKAAESALRESERRARAVLETATDAILTIGEAGVIESANPATTSLFGYSPDEMVGHNVTMLMPEPYRSEHAGYLQSYLRTGRARIIGIGREVTAVRKDGTTFPIHLSVSEVPLGDRRLFTGIIHDLSGRRELERQIIEASTAEQRRIGQDLHDGLCQDLIGIAFQSDQIARELRALPAGAPKAGVPQATEAAAATALAARVEQAAASIREAAAHARRLSHGLNPVDLKGGGLPTALEALARKVSETYHIACTFDWDGSAQVWDDASATHLYRIAQEATGNAIRHGKARRVELSLALHGAAGLQMTVRDDGRGVAAPAPRGEPTGPAPGSTGAAHASGIGLRTMQYRAHVIGGVFDIRPHPHTGTVVTCTLSDASRRPGTPRANPDAARTSRAMASRRKREDAKA